MTKTLLFGCAALAILLGSCHKGETNGPDPALDSPLRAEFNDHVANATQTFTVSTTSGGTIMGTHGTRVIFGPNAFLFPNGGPVSGMVQVDLVEALTIGDMIWLNKQTVGNDNGNARLLRSGGEVRITATYNGVELRVVPNTVWIGVPDNTPDPAMELFMGRTLNDGNMLWDPVDSSSIQVVEDTSWTDPYYAFTTDSLGWINCDYFYNYPSLTSLGATIPDGQPMDSTLCWIGFPSENAVMNMAVVGATYQTWQSVPVGMQAVVVGLYRNGTNYYSSFNTVTIAPNMTVPMTFSPTTLAQFQSDIDGI